ncbi:MAG: hypothetical protein ACM3ZB_04595 [bacterium]
MATSESVARRRRETRRLLERGQALVQALAVPIRAAMITGAGIDLLPFFLPVVIEEFRLW